MGDSKLCLLLLLSTSALAFAQDEDQPTCLLAQRYKSLHKYEYYYNAESLNAINGASQLKNGPKASCKVEIEVPQTCSFIIRTTGCRLMEVVNMDAEGNPLFADTPGSDAFAAEMERYPLKVVVEGVYDVKLYPEDGETTTILNFKRGIISALAVPLLEEDKNKWMPTIHGKCRTHYVANAREDIATDISLNRDLSRCDKFVPMRDHTSPLALITGMNYPLAKLIRSSQACNYRFDNDKKHMTFGSCTENHILIPFSHKGEYGVTNVGKQMLTLVKVSPHNDRVFGHSGIVKDLHMEAAEDKSAVQDKDAVLNLLRELATLPENKGEKRAHLFHKLVSMVRGMKTENLSPVLSEALTVSRVLTYQVLAQCGTPECSSAIMRILRTFDSNSFEADATVFALGLISNPSALLINDMLEMAKYKSSKPIMYALSNVLKRFYKAEGKFIPEIYSVAEFMAAKLGDCSGNKDNTFMTLRVIGNMAPAVVPASPALRATVLQCVNQPAASLDVQQAAIQVFRLTPLADEGRKLFMEVLLDSTSPMQKRIAAYLVLMKNPQPNELTQLANALPSEQDQQVRSFIISHFTNILSSTGHETQELREKIQDAMQGNDIGPIMDPTKFSRNYKIGSLEGNMIFEGTSYLPKEVMLEMTLKAFGYDIDMMEIGMEGKGFEPTVDVLFGENGFFPDTAMKTIYFVSENMPQRFHEILKNMIPALTRDRINRQNLLKEIGSNVNKLVRELKTVSSPEAMVYLRLLGNELGYLRTSEIEGIAFSAAMMIDSMFKMFPTDLMKALMTKADNTIFAHYIFMDNEFFLPTVTGMPLRVALSGTFTPGIKGGLNIARDMSEVTFMPSAGIEFITQVGSHIPEYVNSGLEMHSNIFHESGVHAKIAISRDNIKLTIPAPTSPMKLIKMTNNLVAVIGSEVKMIPPIVMDKVNVSECNPVFAGMNYCTALQYADAFSQETAPYFPLTGDSNYVVELHPTGEVAEYTATIAYEVLREGDDGQQKVDSVQLILKADGAESTEARAVMKYNRRKHAISADIQIPDYDVEAGLRLGVVDENTKGKRTHSIYLNFINKNIPQLSLVGRANLKEMKESMLQVQLLVPSISADATVTATMKRDEELELELKSEIKVMDAISEQKISMKYDATKIEVEVKSDVNTKTTIFPNAGSFKMYGNELLDMQVGQTDMKVRHIFKKFVEATNNYMEEYGADFPYIQNFRVPDMPEISLPETLFLNIEAKAVYYINNDHYTVVIPLPLGGKSTDELNFPPALTTPGLSLHQFGLEIPSMEIPISELVVPESITLSIPLFGRAEVSTMMKSNLYEMETSVAFGLELADSSTYSAKFDIKGTSPLDILSVKLEGSGMVTTTDSIKAKFESSLTHTFIQAKIDMTEDMVITNKISLHSSSKVEAGSHFGLGVVLNHTSWTEINTEEMASEHNFEGEFKAGPIYGKTMSAQSFSIIPSRLEARIDSTVQLDSNIVKARNVIDATLVKGEVSVVSKTNAFEDVFNHKAKLTFRDTRLSLMCDANALGVKMRNQVEAFADLGKVYVRIETNADRSENRVYSLLSAAFDINGLTVNSDTNVKLLENEATHKAILIMNKDGLTTNGTTTLQSPLSMENTFTAGLDATQATLSIISKAVMHDIKVDNANNLLITLSSFDFNSKTQASVSEYASYTHDITFNLNPYTVAAKVNNNLKLLTASFINEAQLQAEDYKIDLTGSLKAIYGEEETKHIYHINYDDMSANVKCITYGKFFGTSMNHDTEIKVIGFTARIAHEVHYSSEPLSFVHSIRCNIVPFDFKFDATFNADGAMNMYGRHSANLYSKILLRAQPMSFASSHDCRASVSQQLNNGFSLDTTFENKIDTSLSLQEQKTSFAIKSKMNEHAFDQDINVYNTVERTGIEVSGKILTNIINTASTENQEFSISGFLKYDKNTDSHIIHFPLIENLPVFLEDIKGFVVHVAEALQNFINKEDIVAKLQGLPHRISDLLVQINLEENAIQLIEYFSDFTKNYVIYTDDVETFLRNVKVIVERLLANLSDCIQRFFDMMNEAIFNYNFPETIFQKVQEWLNSLNEVYDFKAEAMYVINTIREMIQSFDLESLKGSSFAFLHDIDAKYDIKAELQSIIRNIVKIIETFDLEKIVAELKRLISSIDFKAHIEELLNQIPKIIQDLDILRKINTFNASIRELTVKFEIDKTVQAILEKAVELIKKFKIDKTIEVLARMMTDISIFFLNTLEVTIDYLKTNEFKAIIQDLNILIEITEEELKSFSYNKFVHNANQMTALFTQMMNEMIQIHEIPQKLEAMYDFVSVVLSSVRGLTEHLREIKVAEFLKSLKDIFDEIVFGNLKLIAQLIKDKIASLDIKAEMTSYRDFVITYYQRVINILNDMFTSIVKMITKVVPDQKIIHEIQQIINGLFTELKKAEINMPSFTIPLTDLAVPSIRFSMDKLAEFEVPTQLDIPEFTILGFHTVKATTISIDDIQQRIIELTDLIINFNIQMFDVDAFFGDLTMNYLPSMPEISFPVITLPEISLPTIPQAPKDTLRSLQVPEIKLPTIPTEIMVPSFGKLYGEIKLHTPIYTIKMSAEFQNSTNNAMLPQFTGLFTSQGKSPSFEILNYKLDSTAGIAFPKMSRVVLGETVKFQNPAFSADHQASVTFYGRSAQAQERTEIRVTTALYTATFLNIGDIAVEEGMSAFLDTTYKHVVDIPFLAVRNDITLTQGARLHQDGYTLTLTADNTGMFNSDSPNHNSRLYLSLTPQTVNVTFTGDTDCSMLKMKQRITAETSMFSYLKFNVHNEAEAPIIKNSLFEASGLANLHDMQVKVNTNHYTEVYGAVIGDLSNSVNILAHPGEVFFEFQNKGNAKLNSFEYLSAKIDLQNDYMANFSPGSQKVNTVMLARLNKYKVMYNFTLDNNVNEAGIFTAMESEASFDFLTYPLSIPELDLPFVDFHTPAISDLNLYEQTGLKNILTTTDQTLEVDTKIVYQKSKAAPLVDMMDLIQIPSMGNLITELSIKSAITDLNVNAKLYTEDDLEFRFEATTASVFEALKAQLVGTTSLTTKRGIRLANSLFLANPHVEGFHNSSMSLSTDTFETDLSVATVAKIDLPILNLHATQELIADTKTKPNASFTLKMSGNFSIPVINTVGSAEADHKMKLKGTSEYISVASSTKANMDGTLYEDYQVFGVLDNEINLLLNNDGLHSSSKVIADAKLNHGTTKVIGMDLNETLSVEASMSRVNALLKYNGNNEAKLFNFNTNGKHIAEARVDFAPTSSLIADFDIHMSQPSSLGDFSFFEKTVAEVTPARQKIFTDTKLVSQLWNISMAAEVEGSAPIFKVIVKSSAISAFVVLEYNMNASTANFENEAFNILSKIVLTHADLNMNVEHAITQALRRMHQTDDSVSQHALNVDITSATFSDVNFRYAARRDGVSASISSPTTGFLAFQFSGVVPSQMGARIYGRYPSAPDVDVDILVIRSTPKGSDKMNLQIAYSMGAPKAMLSEIKMRLPSIISTFASFADKYQITGSVEGLKDSLINHINEIYNDAVNVEMSQLSIFFRYTIVQYQKTFQVFLDAVIKFLRETKFRLPGSDEMTSLPIVLKRLTNSIAAVVEVAIQIIYDTMEASYNVFLERISSVRLHMPVGDAVNGGQIINQAKTAFKNIFDEMVNILKNMESLDTMLEKIGETLKAVVEKTQEFVDSIKSDYLDGMLININRVYNSLVIDVKHAVDQIAALTTEDLKRMCEFIIDMLIYVVDEFNYGVFDFLQASEDLQAHAKVRNGKLEIDVPFQFQQ